jgi:flagellar hook protein FlgE
MMRGMFAAISGLRVHQVMLDVTANDISNVNTVGYKSERATFKDALSQNLRGASAPSGSLGGTNAAQVGLGVQLNSIDNLMSPGAIQSTGNTMDMAIQGDGWFRVTNDPAGFAAANTYYTRAGNFTRDANGDLVTPDGYYLVGNTAALGAGAATKITIPANATSFSIDPKGAVTVVTPLATTTTYVTLAKFPNEAGLQREGGNRFSATNNSNNVANPIVVSTPGDATQGFGSLTTGAVEMSNVDLAQEFTNLITAQRGFQANSRVISTADDMLQELVNLKR